MVATHLQGAAPKATEAHGPPHSSRQALGKYLSTNLEIQHRDTQDSSTWISFTITQKLHGLISTFKSLLCLAEYLNTNLG